MHHLGQVTTSLRQSFLTNKINKTKLTECISGNCAQKINCLREYTEKVQKEPCDTTREEKEHKTAKIKEKNNLKKSTKMSPFFKMVKKIDKPLAKLTNKKREDSNK